MTLTRPFRTLLLFVLVLTTFASIADAQVKPGRDPNQPIDQDYTNKIREYTTAPYFNSPLTDYLPASRRADAESRPRRRLGRSRKTAVRRGRLQVHADAGAREPAREGLLDRHD